MRARRRIGSPIGTLCLLGFLLAACGPKIPTPTPDPSTATGYRLGLLDHAGLASNAVDWAKEGCDTRGLAECAPELRRYSPQFTDALLWIRSTPAPPGCAKLRTRYVALMARGEAFFQTTQIALENREWDRAGQVLTSRYNDYVTEKVAAAEPIPDEPCT